MYPISGTAHVQIWEVLNAGLRRYIPCPIINISGWVPARIHVGGFLLLQFPWFFVWRATGIDFFQYPGGLHSADCGGGEIATN